MEERVWVLLPVLWLAGRAADQVTALAPPVYSELDSAPGCCIGPECELSPQACEAGTIIIDIYV